MNLKSGIERVEKALNVGNTPCVCSRDFQGVAARALVRFPEDDDQTPAMVCQDCGGQMILIRVAYDEVRIH